MSKRGLTNIGLLITVGSSALGLIAWVGNYLNSEITTVAEAQTASVQRISVVETKVMDLDPRLIRIENKLDGILLNLRNNKNY